MFQSSEKKYSMYTKYNTPWTSEIIFILKHQKKQSSLKLNFEKYLTQSVVFLEFCFIQKHPVFFIFYFVLLNIIFILAQLDWAARRRYNDVIRNCIIFIICWCHLSLSPCGGLQSDILCIIFCHKALVSQEEIFCRCDWIVYITVQRDGFACPLFPLQVLL